MAADVSAFVYFLPILSFLVVFTIMLAVLNKTKILGENLYIQLFFSFVMATIFVTATSVRQLVLNVLPWFAVLLTALFLLMVLIGFMGKTDAMIGSGVGWIFIVILIIIFLVSGVKVFSGTLGPYLPGSPTLGTGDPTLTNFFEWVYSPQVGGALLLIMTAALVSWVLVKTGGMKGK